MFINNIIIIKKITSEKHKDEKINVEIHYFLCEALNTNIILSEHEDMKWVFRQELLNYNLAPGDSKIIKYLL